MRGVLIPIYGSFAIHSFGCFIALGLCLFSYFFLTDPQRAAIITTDDFFTLLNRAIIAGLCGGRMLFMITNKEPMIDFFCFWHGGFSLLGALIAILLVVAFYVHTMKIPLLPFLDLAALYAPLLQAIARIGCLSAGCCYGTQTTAWWAVRCIDASNNTLFHKWVHPTQLYSSGALFTLFLLLLVCKKYNYGKPGFYILFYLMGMSIERFCMDYLRGDQEWILLSNVLPISIHQLIACSIFCVSASIALYYYYVPYTFKRASL
jgi:phosphatidylglycerol---prolipoprotein diacylglyceryl transferase